jgi:glycosyltransferase involved in cell wall biosynthesis
MADAGQLRVLVLGTAWGGNGGHTVNRQLSVALAQLGHDVVLRIAGPAGGTLAGVTIQTLDPPIPGLNDRAQLLRTDGLPRNVDILIGAGRFSSGAASYLRDQWYPGAKAVHFVHAAVDVLDRYRGDPQQANEHMRTERDLIARSDLAVGVGPLLTDEAMRMARMLENPTPVHEMIPGVVLKEPPRYFPDQTRLTAMLFGRADDELKGADTAAHLVAELRSRGVDIGLVVRGSSPQLLARQETHLSNLAGVPVKVRSFTGDQRELDSDLRASDLVVIPSRQEGFPLTALEAGEMGIPFVVGSNAGAGMFFGNPDRVPAELGAASVVQMQGNESAAELGRRWADHIEPQVRDIDQTRGRALALRSFLGEHFTWQHAAAEMVEQVRGLSAGSDQEAAAAAAMASYGFSAGPEARRSASSQERPGSQRGADFGTPKQHPGAER